MTDVLIVGAGLAGLSCACELVDKGLSCLLLEASDGVGGRARTDRLNEFLLDRGFQILLTAYPEAQRILDYRSLQLRPFEPGALVRIHGRFHRIADPWRRPSAALSTLLSPVGTLADKLKLARLRSRLIRASSEVLLQSPETSTIEFLHDCGFSPRMIECFFRPFLGGVFLESELQTSSRMFEFVFRMFSSGDAALPVGGMGSMAQQLLSRLPEGCVRLRQKVAQVAPCFVRLASGQEIRARSVVVATDNAAAAQLLPEIQPLASRGTTCFYFAAENPPISEPVLVLNGEGRGPVNNLCVPSLVAPSYAPPGAHLVSATVIGKPDQDAEQFLTAVQNQLAQWFGSEALRWRHLRTYWIPDALPDQSSLAGGANPKENRVRPGLYVCGDHRYTASINGALASGWNTAQAILAELNGKQIPVQDANS
jgi:phytoene dehydrogenase-like protein